MATCWKCGEPFHPGQTQCARCARTFVKSSGPSALSGLLVGIMFFVFLFVGAFFHIAHLRLGMEEVGNWIYWVGGAGCLVGAILLIQKRRTPGFLTMIAFLALICAAWADSVIVHNVLASSYSG